MLNGSGGACLTLLTFVVPDCASDHSSASSNLATRLPRITVFVSPALVVTSTSMSGSPA